jgi:hypothetical protein
MGIPMHLRGCVFYFSKLVFYRMHTERIQARFFAVRYIANINVIALTPSK